MRLTSTGWIAVLMRHALRIGLNLELVLEHRLIDLRRIQMFNKEMEKNLNT